MDEDRSGCLETCNLSAQATVTLETHFLSCAPCRGGKVEVLSSKPALRYSDSAGNVFPGDCCITSRNTGNSWGGAGDPTRDTKNITHLGRMQPHNKNQRLNDKCNFIWACMRGKLSPIHNCPNPPTVQVFKNQPRDKTIIMSLGAQFHASNAWAQNK